MQEIFYTGTESHTNTRDCCAGAAETAEKLRLSFLHHTNTTRDCCAGAAETAEKLRLANGRVRAAGGEIAGHSPASVR